MDYHGLFSYDYGRNEDLPHTNAMIIYIYIDTVYLGEPAGRYRQSKWLSTLVNHQLFLEVFGQ
jgi:hypothetical protein